MDAVETVDIGGMHRPVKPPKIVKMTELR
jgi:hypothetical protein